MTTMIVLDEGHLFDICGDDKEFWRAILDEYVSDGEANFENLRKALVTADQAAAFAVLHRFKGSSSSAGAIELASLLAELEDGVESRGVGALQDQLPELEAAWSRLRSHLGIRFAQEAA